MKTTHLLTAILFLTVSPRLFAVNTPITVTGFNADEVIENNSSHFATSADGHANGPVFFESGLGGHSDGLPSSRSFTSSGSGTQFTLQPYGANGIAANNALRLFDGATATLTLSTPVSLSSLSILAFTSSGTGSDTALPLTIHFTDGSSLSTTYSAPDWAATSNAIGGLGRSGVSGTGFSYDTGGTTFGMTETILNLTSSGTKSVQSLTFTGANDFSTYTTTSVMAVSAAVPEPSTFALLALAASGFALRRRLTRK